MKKQYNIIKYIKDCLFDTAAGAYFRLFLIITIIETILASIFFAAIHLQKTNPTLFNNITDSIFLTIAAIIGAYAIFGISYNIYQNYKKHERQYYEK